MAKNIIKVQLDFPDNIADYEWLEARLNELLSDNGICDGLISPSKLTNIAKGLSEHIQTELVIPK